MYFSEVAHSFDQIDQTSSRLEITSLLAHLLKQADPIEAAIIVNLALGALHPAYMGTRFNFAQKSFIGVLAEFGSISKHEVVEAVNKFGDLGVVAQALNKGENLLPLTVTEIYERLLHLEKISGIGSQEQKTSFVVQLLRELNPLCAKFVVRIITATLRLGFSDMTLVDALSWMEAGNKSLRVPLEEAYNICSNLGFVAKTLKAEGIEGVKKIQEQPGMPVRLAAAERLASPEAIIKKLGPCVAQPKIDGMRLQAHVENEKGTRFVKLFSRNLLDVTEMFPDIVAALEKIEVDKMIIDGEAVSHNTVTDTFLPFQETAKRRRKYEVAQLTQDFPMRYYVFDILYLSGHDLIEAPYTERRALLAKVLEKNEQDVVRLIDQVSINSAQELEAYFLEMVEAGLEGVMVKKPTAVYQAGKRNFNWIKLKRLAGSELEDSIDVVVLGYYHGAGKRASFGIGAFLVGVYDKKRDRFETVAKVGTGLSDVAWHELKKRCDAVAVAEKPKNVECAKELQPAVWTAPEIVCTIRADEITLSPVHTAGKTEDHLGFALRFPRFMTYRSDKAPEQATEISELRQLFKDQRVRKIT